MPLAVLALLAVACSPSTGDGRGTADQEEYGLTRVLRGGPDDAFGVVVLGVLGDDLYAFGSQGESAGALAGVGRISGLQYQNVGRSTVRGGTVDYNRLTEYGASPYRGRLYVGDRRTGGLFQLVLDPEGHFVDVVQVGTAPSGEDVFPGPVLQDRLYLGSYGKDTGSTTLPDSNARVMTYDGSRIATVLELTALGKGGEVLSMTPFEGRLYVTAANKARSLGELWAIDPDGTSERLYAGRESYRLTALDGELVGSRSSYDGSVDTLRPYVVRWTGTTFERLSEDFGEPGTLTGVLAVGGDLLLFHYYAGVFLWRDGQLRHVTGAPPRVSSATVHEGQLWLAGNQPSSLWRIPLVRGRLQAQ